MSEIFMASKRSMVYRNVVVDIGDGSAEEVTKAMEMVDKGIEEEQYKRWAEFLKNHPVHLVRTDEDEREEQVESLIENMRWLGLRDRIDDIRDLLYINNLNQSAVLELMINDFKLPSGRRKAVDEQLGNIKKIGKSMKERNNRTEQRIRKLQDELDALINGEG